MLSIAAALVAWLAGGSGPARADDIKIGEINSYSGLPAFTEPYRKGWQLALEEVNAKGGVNGDKLVVISKDDGGKPADAVTAANQLVESDRVVMLMGTFFSNIGLAVSDYAKQKKIFFLAAEPLTDAITWSQGHRYTFRLRPSNSMQASMLAEEAAKLPAKRWASVAPNYDTASRPSRRSRKRSPRSARTSNGSPSNGRRRARSTPARWFRRWPRRSPRRFST